VCVGSGHGNTFASGANDCTNNGGTALITGLQFGDSAKSITLDTIGNTGMLFVGTGTHQTTLDGSNGNINLAGTLNLGLGAGGITAQGSNNIDFGGNAIHGVGAPTANTDAANKAYVDSAVDGGNKSFTNLTVTGTSSFGSTGQTQIDSSGNVTLTNTNGDKVSITSDAGNGIAGFKATSGTSGRAASLSAQGLVLDNGTENTVVLDSQTGNGSFGGDIKVGGGLTVNGTTNLKGGVNVTGASSFDGVATFTNTAIAGQGSSQINGGVMTLTNGTNPSQTITLNANADPVIQVNGGSPADTTTINNGTVSVGTSVTVGTSAANQTIINNGTVTAVSVNAANVNAGNLTVAPGGNIDMGGNVVHGVGTPILGTDAANKAYVDNGFSQLRQEDRRLQSGIAMAAAIPHTVVLPGERVAFGVDWGNYAGANAVGFDSALKLGELNFAGGLVSVQANGGFSASGDGAGRLVTKAGLRFGF
jgi:hypothetical protein